MATIKNNRSTIATDPIRNFRFLVTFKPLNLTGAKGWFDSSVTMGFTSVSGLSVTTNSIPYREGGYNTTVHQIPGQTTFAPISLQRGVILGTSQNWNWMRQLFATVNGGAVGSAAQNFRADLEIQVLNHPIAAAGSDITAANATTTDSVAQRFQVYNCWPTSVSYSDLNAGDNALFVEQMTLVHEGFDVNWGSVDSSTGKVTDAPTFD